jgi:hypothetical protein
MSTTICATNRHDRGLDLVEGSEITGAVIGRVSWDDNDDNPGYVLRVGEDERAPDTIDDVIAALTEAGYELDSVSLQDVAELAE